ncbi:MAG: hypothetical protein GY899_08645 [Verrucomicrobiaceae bacterium]|nr:hypothetical protein [Verrucomicrobiaceae bacterium]
MELFLRILLGGVFCVAGAWKIDDPMLFESIIRNYRILGDPWIAWVAMFMPPFELIAGVCVILRLLYPGCVIVLGGSLVFFMLALASLLIRGIDTECGCLGITTTIQLQLLIDCGLCAVACVLLCAWRNAEGRGAID